MTLQKSAGADCPRCREMFCAEFAMLGQPPRWRCGTCGAEGLLTGPFTARKATPPSAPAPARR